jgi:hypothetical protein
VEKDRIGIRGREQERKVGNPELNRLVRIGPVAEVLLRYGLAGGEMSPGGTMGATERPPFGRP